MTLLITNKLFSLRGSSAVEDENGPEKTCKTPPLRPFGHSGGVSLLFFSPDPAYLQPEQVAQCPEHFFAGLPVAENISPAHSRCACAPQAGQRTASSYFPTSSSNFFPHCGQTYCKTGMCFSRAL